MLFAFVIPVSAKELSVNGVTDLSTGTFTGSVIPNGGTGVEINVNSSWNAITWRTPDKTLTVGSAFTSDGNDLYVLRGSGDILFWKYTPSTDTWTTLANSPFGAYYGADIVYVNGYIYTIFGGYQAKFARYSIVDNSWEVLPDFPELIYRDAALTTDGTDLYAIVSNNTQGFYKYSVANEDWSPLAATPNTMNAGSDIEYDNGYIYALRGNSTVTLYRYQISNNTWTTLANAPATFTEETKMTLYNGAIYVTRQAGTNSFYKYNISGNTWSTLTTTPMVTRYAGVQKVGNDGILYVFRGNGDYRFWKYNTATNAFVGPNESPVNLGVGSDAVYYNGALYVPAGTNTTTFYKYTVATNAWNILTAAPGSFNDDTRGVQAGDAIYFFRGGNVNTFYRYNVTANTWDTLAVAPAAVRFGGALAYPGSGDFIYATRGSGTNTFWAYSISGNSWVTTLPALPAGIQASYGTTLTADGSGSVFFTAGTGISRMYKYSIAGNNWTEMSALPFSPYYGSDVAYSGNGKLLALAGWYKTDLWEYTIATNTWRYLKEYPGYYATEYGAYQGSALASDTTGNYYLTRGIGRPEMLSYTAGMTDYDASGIWKSPSYDLNYVSGWTSVGYIGDTPSDSSIVIRSRTSANGTDWSGWENAVSGNIVSPVNKYIQFSVLLLPSSDSTKTPVLRGLTLNYNSDITAPSVPSNISGLSNEVGGEAITSGAHYIFTSPYFSWDASTDNETYVNGYYVYWGNNSNADPVTEGSFQTGTSFSVTNTMLNLGSNYLRVVSQDALENKSSAVTLFTYEYDGVGIVSVNAGAVDFAEGVLDDTQITAEGIKLASDPGGFWLQERLTPPTITISYGSKSVAYIENNRKFYIATGNGLQFYEYDLDTNIWTRLADSPQTVGYGGGTVNGPNGYIYATRGNNSTDFYRYSIANNTWDTGISSVPLTIGYGSSLVYDGTQYIYVLRGNGSDYFWRYDTLADTWESLSRVDYGAPTITANNAASTGGCLAIDKTNKLIYSIQGNSQPGFSVYNIDTDQWTGIPSVPILTGDGASLAFDDINGGLYLTPGNYYPYLYKYDPLEGEWTQLSNSPLGFGYGGVISPVQGFLYAIRASGTNGFYKYDIEKDSWLMPKRGLFGREFEGSSLFNTYYGADIIKGDGDNYYIIRGYLADDFIRWNEKTGELVRLRNLPMGSYVGGSMVYDYTQNVIYYTGGTNDTGFFKYNIATGVWSEETSDKVPAVASYGTSMEFDGRYIYYTRANGSTIFNRYDPQANAGSRWSVMNPVTGTLGSGSEMVINDGYIYTLRGNTTNNLYRYSIAGNSWATMNNAAFTIAADGFITDGKDGYLYAARGNNTSSFFKYSLTGNSWENLPDFPGQVYAGGAGESNGVNTIYALPGNGTNTFQDALYSYIMQTDDSSFITEGSYISEVYDLTSVYKWASLDVNFDVNRNTNLTIETSSSTNGTVWSDWAFVTKEREIDGTHSYKINSAPARYIKARFSLLSGDGILSPVISSYSINYYQDLNLPTNPSNGGLASLSSAQSGTPINANTWYNYTSPSFSWPSAGDVLGASDGVNGSGVSGYYVYWGSDETAVPKGDGQFQQSSTFVPTNLVDATTYHLRVQTVDAAGNISDSVWAPFVYKYDISGPQAPSSLSADPSGYTSVNDFAFSWSPVTANGAQVIEYCYKTGAANGQHSTEQCIEDTEIVSITSYKVGTNTFQVRAKDEGGNFSPYATVNYFFVDYENAPAPPLNLRATPESSTQNAFGFTWDPPAAGTYYGSQSNLSYLYSVNALPTSYSTSATSLRYLNAGAYATLPGENIFYIVTKDEAGNVNYSNYTSVSFFANTVAPGLPLNLEIADVSVKSKLSWRLAVSWDAPEDAGSGIGGYQIYRSVDGEHFFYHSFTSGESLVDSKLIQTTYYYKVKACDSTNNCGAFSEIVSLFPDGRYIEPATLIINPQVSNITPKKATVSWVTARTADSRIAYGEEPGVYFEEEVSNSEQVVDHILTINNLSPGKKYYYVAKWTDEDGNMGASEESTFETAPPPSIEEPIVKNVGLNSALIEFKTKDTVKVKIYYGETSSFGGVLEVYTGTQESTHDVEIPDIKDGTKYFFKINTFDIDGSEYEGETHSFETLPKPEVSEYKIYQVSGTSKTVLLVEWSSNTPVSSIVTYYPTVNPALAEDEVNVALKTGKHRMILLDLDPNTTYSIIVKGRDFMGNEASSGVINFQTASDTRPPKISDLEVNSEIIGSGQEATAQVMVSYKTDEDATAQIEYGEGTGTTYTQKTQEDSNLSGTHIVIISGLTPSKVYHFRAVSKDYEQNVGYSVDKVVVTNPTTANALDLAISNLTSIFSFLGTK